MLQDYDTSFSRVYFSRPPAFLRHSLSSLPFRPFFLCRCQILFSICHCCQVSIDAKWIKDGETRSRCEAVRNPRVVKEKEYLKLSGLRLSSQLEIKLAVGQRPMQEGSSCVGVARGV
ncbi:hypothetical protein TNCV_1320171 [Trichonephila clavipes]|nr:hypothetical protein TNCV_1320171 [Trichonephila clavipes]